MNRSTQIQNKVKVFVTLLTGIFLLFVSHTVLGAPATPAEIQDWLKSHNTYRNLHGSPDVAWSATVAASAQAWADTCPSGHSGSIYGENIAFASYNPGVGTAVDWWYSEEPDYDYNNPGFSSATGHFTQVVWKSTTEIGCGYRTGCPGSWPNIWVCQYNPPGNYLGKFAENVFPPDTPLPGGGQQGGGALQHMILPPIYKLLLRK